MVDAGAWGLIPPIAAIGLALATRRVFQSLGLGIFLAGLIVASVEAGSASGATAWGALGRGLQLFMQWIIAGIAEPGNAGIFTFILFLGGIIALLQRSGGVAGFGEAAMRWARTKRRAQSLAWLTGSTALAIDDHFNVIAAGTMFRPVTDRLRISREKLAYIIDSTGAPVAILNPVSTWAGFMIAFTASSLVAAGSSANAFETFIASIPSNYYAWATLLWVLLVALSGVDFGPMRRAEHRAAGGAVLGPEANPLVSRELSGMHPAPNARPLARNLFLPLGFLFVAAVLMLWATGHQSGFTIRQSFANASAPVSLAIATFLTILFCMVLYALQGALRHDESLDATLEGFKAMVPALTILAMAFALGIAVQEMGLGRWVALALGDEVAGPTLPLLTFVVAAFMAFATGTSFGTFAIMIPLSLGVTSTLPDAASWYAPVLAAASGGGVFGDHCSPISDTTVLSSMAAQCDHVDHVRTQLPYALATAFVAASGYALVAIGVAGWLALVAVLLLSPLLFFGAARWRSEQETPK